MVATGFSASRTASPDGGRRPHVVWIDAQVGGAVDEALRGCPPKGCRRRVDAGRARRHPPLLTRSCSPGQDS